MQFYAKNVILHKAIFFSIKGKKTQGVLKTLLKVLKTL